MRKIELILIVTLITLRVNAQADEIGSVLSALKKQMNLRLPVSDSLCPTIVDFKSSYWQKGQSGLSKKELKELKHQSKYQDGIKLCNDLLPDVKLISAAIVYQALNQTSGSNETTAIKYAERYRPFYIISRPLFFGNGKAIVHLTVIGNGGTSSTFLLDKKTNNWVIEKQI